MKYKRKNVLFIITMFIALLVGLDAISAAEPLDLEIGEYAPASGTFPWCTHILFRGEREIITAGKHLHIRDKATEHFRDSPVMLFDDPHSVAYNPSRGL